jgi:hypothetical protein
VPFGTYWFIAKRFWAHTPLEKFLLFGMVANCTLLFVASLIRRRSTPFENNQSPMDGSA